MKPIYIAILFVLPFISIAQTQKTIPLAEIGIRGRDCNGGLGLCSMSGASFQKNTLLGMQIQLKSSKEIGLLLPKAALSKEDLKSFSFLKDTNITVFIQQEDYSIPLWLLEELDIGKTEMQIIKKGYYPVLETKDTYEVIFNLQ